MRRFFESGWTLSLALLVMIVIVVVVLAKLTYHEAVDPKFELIGRLEGCNVYHQPGPYGGSAFAICHQ